MAGTEGNDEMNVLKTLVTSLAQSVQTLTARQAAPTEQLKDSEELTSTPQYQQHCLKGERECGSKKQGIMRQQNLLDELQTKVKAIAASVETSKLAYPTETYS